MLIVSISIVILVLVVILIVFKKKKKEPYVKIPGKGFVKVPSRKPHLPANTVPFKEKSFKNPDNWEIYNSIVANANGACSEIENPDDQKRCKSAFPLPHKK
jgi:hypothetical protein